MKTALQRRVPQVIAIAVLLWLVYVHTDPFQMQFHTPRPVSDKIVQKLLNSLWIQLFPNLIHMVQTIGYYNSSRHVTAANNTVLELSKAVSYRVGRELKATITARDERGERKRYGGDFFEVTLRRPGAKINGVSCQVFDNFNGTYDVSCILPWEGEADLRAVLVHPSESIYEMMKTCSSEKEYGLLKYATVNNSKGQVEQMLCSTGYPDKSPDELCDYSNPRHGEKRTCLKPPSGECSPIIWEDQAKANHTKLRYFDDLYFRLGNNYKAAIVGSGTKFSVLESKLTSNVYTGSINKIDTDPMSPTGWFLGYKWISTKVKVLPLNSDKLKKCVTNKRLYFFGDSTMRQWFYFITGKLNLKHQGPDNTIAWSQPRNASSGPLNATFHYKAHGPPLHNPGPPGSRPYISNSLDDITEGGRGTVVFITLGLHFELLDPDVFYRRVYIIKQSIISLLSRLPGSKVIIKGLHHHEHTTKQPSPWMSFRLEVILRHAFNELEDVVFFETWDFTLLAKIADVHPPERWLRQIIELLICFIC